MPPFPGKVILFSPVIGTATNSEIAVRFYPPSPQIFRPVLSTTKWAGLSLVEFGLADKLNLLPLRDKVK